MTQYQFEVLFNNQVEREHGLLIAKNREYAANRDKLYNFKRAAEVLRKSPEAALWGMFMKHFVSIQDIVERIEQGCPPVAREVLDEKITDARNYLLLLQGLVYERLIPITPDYRTHTEPPAMNLTELKVLRSVERKAQTSLQTTGGTDE